MCCDGDAARQRAGSSRNMLRSGQDLQGQDLQGQAGGSQQLTSWSPDKGLAQGREGTSPGQGALGLGCRCRRGRGPWAHGPTPPHWPTATSPGAGSLVSAAHGPPLSRLATPRGLTFTIRGLVPWALVQRPWSGTGWGAMVCAWSGSPGPGDLQPCWVTAMEAPQILLGMWWGLPGWAEF